ncbi:MAG: tRNA 4-thiouridine(8) synthase ThiI [Bdellovibrio sp.]|nr:MAG: tRNA 4-thiouridine(8) synthase ThiI [Bdellovibrio sp.]
MDKVLIKYASEISLKQAATKKLFQQRVQQHLEAVLEKKGVAVRKFFSWQGGVIYEVGDLKKSLESLKYIFGIHSYYPLVHESNSGLESLKKAILHIKPFIEGKSFVVRCKKWGHYPFKTQELERRLGAVLAPYGQVKMKDPDVQVQVQLLNDRAYFFTEKYMGAQGLPISKKDRVLVLMSGGFDSTVAAWRMLKRGVSVDFFYCNLRDRASEKQVLQISKVLVELWGEGSEARFFSVDANSLVQELKQSIDPTYRQVVLKRMMYRLAQKVAFKYRLPALVTGESLGQVSSQTLQNLRQIDSSVELPVFRPLIGLDKWEIMQEAKKIGTSILSEKVLELCQISKGQPVIHAQKKRLDEEESRFDFSVLEATWETLTVKDVSSLGAKDLKQPYLFVENLPEGAVIIDCQPRDMYKKWHVPGAENYEIQELLHDFKKFDKMKTYVLYCPFGTQTPFVAEVMQQHGFSAYAFQGGLSKLKKQVSLS